MFLSLSSEIWSIIHSIGLSAIPNFPHETNNIQRCNSLSSRRMDKASAEIGVEQVEEQVMDDLHSARSIVELLYLSSYWVWRNSKDLRYATRLNRTDVFIPESQHVGRALIASSSRVAVDMISKLALHLLPVVEDFDYLAGYPWGQTSVWY